MGAPSQPKAGLSQHACLVYWAAFAGSWPQLRKLALADIDISTGPSLGVMQELVHGDWPQLESLSLENMQLDGEGVSVLATGNWRGLPCLDIGENHIASADE